MKIQRVEINKANESNIHCPFCGTLVLDNEKLYGGDNTEMNDISEVFTQCVHTLFLAHDEGFEFRSGRYNAQKSIVGLENDAIQFSEDFEGWDMYTNDLEIADSIKFALFDSSPMGSYLGFAPLRD